MLDDFGTGYSSLSYLKHLPLDTIKIDRSFVAGLDGDADRSIVDAVIALAHGLRIEVVAEGIETEAQFETLRAIGCDLGQGYLFASPCRPPTRPGCCAEPIRRRPGRAKPEAEPKPSRPVVRQRSRVRARDRSVERRAGDGRRREVPRRAARDEGQRLPRSRSMNRNRFMKSR